VKGIKLTRPQQRFFDAIREGKSNAEAYKAAGFPGSARVASVEAARKNGQKIATSASMIAALASARAPELAASAITVESLVADLQESRRVAFACDPPQVAASVAATVAIAKLLGLQVDRAQLDVILHKPGFSIKALELTEDEWKRQFALPKPKG
jgi:hypothetical protein